MMFIYHVAFNLGLMALVSGAGLYIWSIRNKGAGSSLGKIFGLIVLVLSIASIACTLYCELNHVREATAAGQDPFMSGGSCCAHADVDAPKQQRSH